jgi:hypothetical protein
MAEIKKMNKPQEVKPEKLPEFIQLSIDELSEKIIGFSDFLFTPFQIKQKYLADCLNFVLKNTPDKRYEFYQYVNSYEYPDIFIFKLKK